MFSISLPRGAVRPPREAVQENQRKINNGSGKPTKKEYMEILNGL
jgi:hypothetical protein